jgi:hypothetical protein
VFSRQFWTLIFQKLKLYAVRAPDSTSRFYGWWCCTLTSVPEEMCKGLNSLTILVAWEIWKHRNTCVFMKLDQMFRPSYTLWLRRVVCGTWLVLRPSRSSS